MAENKNQEEENNNKGGIVKIALMGVGGLVLLALGAFVGAFSLVEKVLILLVKYHKL